MIKIYAKAHSLQLRIAVPLPHYIMLTIVQQQCRIIAEHPSRINQVNQLITQILSQPLQLRPALLKPLLTLLSSLLSTTAILPFLHDKIRLISSLLIELLPSPEASLLLNQAFSLAKDKEKLAQKLLEKSDKEDEIWEAVAGLAILSKVAELLFASLESKLAETREFLLRVNDWSELSGIEQQGIQFKRSTNYQALLLAFLSHSEVARQDILKVYRQMGDKILSKLTTPLALAQNCLQRFQQDPEMQVEVAATLFLLVGKYGLELQEFYPRLEALIAWRGRGQSAFELPNSKRFFKLVEAALRSSKVPYKRVRNLALELLKNMPTEESDFAFWATSFLVNLAKKHRKLLEDLPVLSETALFKKHHNGKIRTLIAQLKGDLNRSEYLEIGDFGRVQTRKLAKTKCDAVLNSLRVPEPPEFKIISVYEPL